MSTTTNRPTPEILDKRGAAAYLQVGVRTLDSYMSRRIIPFFRLGEKTIRFKKSDLDAALEKFRVT
jgi:excisionase family DNA binding protein